MNDGNWSRSCLFVGRMECYGNRNRSHLVNTFLFIVQWTLMLMTTIQWNVSRMSVSVCVYIEIGIFFVGGIVDLYAEAGEQILIFQLRFFSEQNFHAISSQVEGEQCSPTLLTALV